MRDPKRPHPPSLALPLLALFAGGAGGAEIAGRIELVNAKGNQAPGVHQTVVYFTPRAPVEPAEPAAEPFEVATVRKDFQPHVLAVPLGSTVSFPNEDQILHNVFSVSGGNRFDLGLYRGGESKATTFEEPGVVQVFCNVHHSMGAYVVVLETPFFTSPETNGEFRLADAPAGPGTLTVWHEQAETVTRELDLPMGEPLAIRLEISRKRVPNHLNKFGKPYRNRRGKAY